MRPELILGLLLAFSGSLWFAPQPARATARSPADCEKLTNWHAYNTCLASFGPRRGERVSSGRARSFDPEQSGRHSRASRTAARPASGLRVQRIAGGRVRATLEVAPRRRP